MKTQLRHVNRLVVLLTDMKTMNDILRPATLAIALAWAGLYGDARAAPAEAADAASYRASLASVSDVDRPGAAAFSEVTAVATPADRMRPRAEPGDLLAALQDISPIHEPVRIGGARVDTGTARGDEQGNTAVVPVSTRHGPVTEKAGHDADVATAGRDSEPATYALMLAGLLLMGFIAQRRTR
jgi:hypothetical protein